MNVILITNNRKDLARLIKKYSKTNVSFFLYSDNTQLHIEAKELCDKYNIEIEVNFYTNYADIERIWSDYYIYSKKVNSWSINAHKKLNVPSSIFFWGINKEGGESSILFNSLLTSYLMRAIIDVPGETQIYIRNSKFEYKDTELVLYLLCKGRAKVSVNILGTIFPYYSKLFLIYFRSLLSISRVLLYTSVKKIIAARPKPNSYNNYCVFHYVGATYKRIQGELPYFEKVYSKGIPVLVLTEGCSLLPLEQGHENIKIQRLEFWLKFSMILKAIKLSFQSIKAILKNAEQISGFIKETEISSILKHHLLIASIKYYPLNLIRHLLLSEFIKDNEISMFRVPGLSNISGILDLNVISQNENIQIFTGVTPLTPHKVYRAVRQFEMKMASKSNAIVFVNEKIKDKYLSQGVKEKNLNTFNSELLSSKLPTNIKLKLSSSILKKINANYSLKILLDACDPGSPVRSPQEHSNYMNAFLRLAKENPEILLIVKPHSGNMRGISESIVKNNMQENIVLLDKNLPGSFFLKYADLLCSRSSTLMYEAVIDKIAVLGVKLEGIVYDNLIEKNCKYVYTVKDLRSIINSLIKDKNYCNERLKDIVKNQNDKFTMQKSGEESFSLDIEEMMIEVLRNRYIDKV